MKKRIIYSFIVDKHPKFAYQASILARSIVNFCHAQECDINIQMTPSVPASVYQHFSDQGYSVRHLTPFGDEKFCNKLAQLPNLLGEACDIIVLLDTDMIAVADCRPLLVETGVQAKIVDFANPKLDILKDVIAAAGGEATDFVQVEGNDELTLLGNANAAT